MAEEPEDEEEAGRRILEDCADRTRNRERTLRLLKRIADALGRPVEDFFTASADGGIIQNEVDGKAGK